MNWRMKLADWISGGELSRLKRRETDLVRDRGVMSSNLLNNIVARAALREIVHMRTPRCASIGKRMADVAEEALK